MKKILFVVMLLLMVGAVSALDLQVTGVYTDSAHPPALNQNATIRTDVLLTNSSSSITTLLTVNFGNGQSSSRSITLSPNAPVSIFDSVTYTSAGTFTVTSTIDPSNTIAEDNEANNVASVTANVVATSTAVTMPSIVLSGNAGTSPGVSVNLSNSGTTLVYGVTITSSTLTSGAYTIPASAVTINPWTTASLYPEASLPISLGVVIPAGQQSGTYTGTITLAYNGQQTTVPISVSVNAIATGPSFTITNLEYGLNSEPRGATSSQTLTITNTGNQILILNIVSTLPSQYQAAFSQSVVTVSPGASVPVTVTLMTPLLQSSARVQISGGITVTATNVPGLTQTASVYMTAPNELSIYKVTVELNNDGSQHSIGSGNTYSKDTKAGTPITLRIFVRNDYYGTSNTNIPNYNGIYGVDINNINVDTRGSGDLSIDETDTLNDLSYGQQDSISIDGSIPSDATNGDTYNIAITASGVDSNGALQRDTFNARIQVNRPQHEITIESATLNPQTVVCGQTTTLIAKLQNTGSANENDAELSIDNTDLALSQRLYGMSLSQDDTATETYSFKVGNNVPSGTYPILLWSYYNGNTQSLSNSATLTVTCGGSSTGNNNNNNGNNNNGNTGTGNNNNNGNTGTSNNNNGNTGTGSTNYPIVTPSAGSTTAYGKASFTESPAYLLLLGAAVVVVLLIIIILLVKFVF